MNKITYMYGDDTMTGDIEVEIINENNKIYLSRDDIIQLNELLNIVDEWNKTNIE